MNEVKIADYDVYNERMMKTMEDKTWWLDEVAADEKVKFIVDFGCGDGALFRYVDSKYPGRFRYIGIENDAGMRLRAAETKGLAWSIVSDIREFKERMEKSYEFRYENAIIVCNSVIHEVYSYGTWKDIYDFWIFIDKNHFKYVAIRDMIPAQGELSDEERDNIIKAIKYSSYSKIFMDFEENLSLRGPNMFTHMNKSCFLWNEFFLKYRYTENWERERNEQYQWDWLYDFLRMDLGNTMLTVQKFQIPWQREKIKEDFGIDWVMDTHMKILLRRD